MGNFQPAHLFVTGLYNLSSIVGFQCNIVPRDMWTYTPLMLTSLVLVTLHCQRGPVIVYNSTGNWVLCITKKTTDGGKHTNFDFDVNMPHFWQYGGGSSGGRGGGRPGGEGKRGCSGKKRGSACWCEAKVEAAACEELI